MMMGSVFVARRIGINMLLKQDDDLGGLCIRSGPCKIQCIATGIVGCIQVGTGLDENGQLLDRATGVSALTSQSRA